MVVNERESANEQQNGAERKKERKKTDTVTTEEIIDGKNFPYESIFDLKRKKHTEKERGRDREIWKTEKWNQFYVKNVTRFRHYEFLSLFFYFRSLTAPLDVAVKDNIAHL